MSWDSIRQQARDNAIDAISAESSKILTLTQEQLAKAIPEGIDPTTLADLMKVIADASLDNSKKAELIKTTTGYAEISVNLLKHLLV